MRQAHRGAMMLAAIFAVVTTGVCLAASMPNELRGEYTFGSGDQCGYLKIDAKGFGHQEDLSCTVLAAKRVSGSPGENSSFQAEFLCQVDDPKDVKVNGLLEYVKLRDLWVLAMRLSVNPNDRKRVSVPVLQLFAKCGS